MINTIVHIFFDAIIDGERKDVVANTRITLPGFPPQGLVIYFKLNGADRSFILSGEPGWFTEENSLHITLIPEDLPDQEDIDWLEEFEKEKMNPEAPCGYAWELDKGDEATQKKMRFKFPLNLN